ncbi:MdtA/MuxA family multidrug efflux RND transporter periplasmic adaptor subunit [Pseudomonas oryzihabitans]|uniref:MdtA/MuxA family multidrug efflux RND transporter periplasmic adaptor subunit n=1 Tax=Pseudomonas oryzihabitans TaxID=47885 RepID=UPI0011A55577|nr:MdtA/MuxA family multidrug efflux RND transporter periplasmic adaptor subunit [Pseudomonas psychrotolerans]
MSRKTRILVVIVLAGVALALGLKLHGRATDTGSAAHGGHGDHAWAGAAGAGAGQAITVAVAQAGHADVPVTLTALGTVVANASVTVTTRVAGQLEQVFFTEGQRVKQGQLLAQIDPRPYQATLDQYRGDLAQNQAQLKSAQLTLERYRRLVAKDSLAKQELDTQVATVGQYQGAVQADQAQIAAAQLNLQYARIVSPIAGYAGLRLVDAGNYLAAGDTTGIVSITQTDPIAVTFSLPQATLASLLPKVRQGQGLGVTALDQLGSTSLAAGSLKFISNEIDTATGSIKLKAVFANPDEKLYPNQFVNVRLQTDTLKNAVVVPAAAVQLGSDGSFVYVVGTEDKVERRGVTPGPALGDRVAITQGLQGDERVVTRGIDHLRDGAQVRVEATPAADASR